MKELFYPPHCCALLVYLLVTLRQSDSSVDEKMMNYWSKIWKQLPRDRKNVVLYTVTIYFAIRLPNLYPVSKTKVV